MTHLRVNVLREFSDLLLRCFAQLARRQRPRAQGPGPPTREKAVRLEHGGQSAVKRNPPSPQNHHCAPEKVGSAPVGSVSCSNASLMCRTITGRPMHPALRSECSFWMIEFSLHLLTPHQCGLRLLLKARARGEDSLPSPGGVQLCFQLQDRLKMPGKRM